MYEINLRLKVKIYISNLKWNFKKFNEFLMKILLIS